MNCPYWRGVRIREVSVRRDLTAHTKVLHMDLSFTTTCIHHCRRVGQGGGKKREIKRGMWGEDRR